MIIDTSSETELEAYEQEREMLQREKESKGVYDSSDIMLVRITDQFPQTSVLPAISNVPYLTRINDISTQVVYDILIEKEKRQKNIDFVDYERELELIEEAKAFSPLSTQYRSSIHFTLNGPVSDHAYGTFDGRVAIIEPFKYHENDENILSVRGDDTYFKDGIKLSNEAVVLVPLELKDTLPPTENNVIFYTGDLKMAINMYLVKNGIVPETVRSAYLEESPTSNLLNYYIASKGYERERHCYHKNYKEDDDKSLELWKYYDSMFYTYLFETVYHDNVNQDDLELLKNRFDLMQFEKRAEKVLKELIENIGLERYKLIVDEYNNALMEKVREGTYPTNNEILGITPINIEEISSNKTRKEG